MKLMGRGQALRRGFTSFFQSTRGRNLVIWRVPSAWPISFGIICCLLAISCDPMVTGAFTFAPRPEARIDSAMQQAVFAAVARVMRQRDFVPMNPGRWGEEMHWRQCFTARGITLCDKQVDGVIQFHMQQGPGVFHFTPSAKRIRQEIADTLQAEFGGSQVRVCTKEDEKDHKDVCSGLITQAGGHK